MGVAAQGAAMSEIAEELQMPKDQVHQTYRAAMIRVLTFH